MDALEPATGGIDAVVAGAVELDGETELAPPCGSKAGGTRRTEVFGGSTGAALLSTFGGGGGAGIAA